MRSMKDIYSSFQTKALRDKTSSGKNQVSEKDYRNIQKIGWGHEFI